MLISKLKRFGHFEPAYTGDFCVFLNYSVGYEEKWARRDYLQIACFDPGVVNTGCRIERRWLGSTGDSFTGFSKVETIYQNRIENVERVKTKSKKPKAEAQPEIPTKGRRGRKLAKPKRQPRVIEPTTNPHYYVTLCRVLNDLYYDLVDCDYILIESQLSRNPEAIRIAQHIISTVMAVVNDCCLTDKDGTLTTRPLIVEVAPHFKSRYFGVRKKKGLDLKKWCVVKACAILEKNNDTIAREIVKKDRKKDDHCDVILYCEAWANVMIDGCENDGSRRVTVCSPGKLSIECLVDDGESDSSDDDMSSSEDDSE